MNIEPLDTKRVQVTSDMTSGRMCSIGYNKIYMLVNNKHRSVHADSSQE